MEAINLEDEEDEIFFGKLTLKEVKKHIFTQRQEPCPIRIEVESSINVDDHNTSLKLIRTQSQPNLISGHENDIEESPVPESSHWLNKDDSFIRMEAFVDEICKSPRNHENNVQLNNTLEVIEYILNNPPTDDVSVQIIKNKMEEKSYASPKTTEPRTINDKPSTANVKDEPVNPEKNIVNDEITKEVDKSPQKMNNAKNKQNLKVAYVDNKHEKSSNNAIKQKHNEGYLTPIHTKSNHFLKTPAQPLSDRIASTSSVKKIPLKTNTYQHINSPVAFYIKNGVRVPSLKNIQSHKHLHVPSLIPKYMKKATIKESEKKNAILSPQAYKAAKTTTMFDVTDENKLPKSLISKISSTLPRAIKLKHICRENTVSKQPNASIDNISYHQAELSICTQESAIKLNKNNLE